MRQLSLGMLLQDRAVFASFLSGGNALALAAAQALAAGNTNSSGDALLYLHGVGGTGKSHLLQAFCAAVPGAGYFPLAQLRELGADVLEGLAGLPAVAIDDLQAVAGDADWERQLFGLYNDCLARGTRLLVAARAPAVEAGFSLPDLRSRLAAMPHFALRPLDETQQRAALQLRAAQRGIELPDETLLYLQRRFARDMTRLHDLLDRLDLASLREQRRLTVPFIREVLGETD
ncbi:MAG: DnaA regulatory inactivator Hda [Steroidobacteraceae bacterium]